MKDMKDIMYLGGCIFYLANLRSSVLQKIPICIIFSQITGEQYLNSKSIKV